MTKSRGLRVSRGVRQAWVAANQGCHFCQCGCGAPINIQVAHFNLGIPKYRLGHNPQPKKARPPRQPCECGCGELASPGRRFVSGHNQRGRTLASETKAKIAAAMSGTRNHRTGKRPANYKGRIVNEAGYIRIHSPEHPFRSKHNSMVMEHRLVMEAHLRATAPDSDLLVEVDGQLYLRPEIEVHHIDGVKDHNVLENLQAMTKAEHTRHHLAERNLARSQSSPPSLASVVV